MRTLILIATAALGLASMSTWANNITVSNTSLGPQNTGNQTIAIHFDVAWENSWRTSNNESNYDGAWLFVKYRNNGTYDWRHCTLDASTTPGAGATLSVSPDGKGAFIHRSADGIGNVSFSGNELIWHYGTDGVLDGNTVEIEVFALEMVYIPEGPFYLGSGGNEPFCFKDGSSNTAYLVDSTASMNGITTGTATGQLNFNGNGSGNIPATFPNGHNAFWIMKYECSQQQFADFLNHLNSNDANAHNSNPSNFEEDSSYPNFAPLAADRAFNGLRAQQLFAFADWAGLRPYSELEFEKAGRGKNIPPVPNEYPWGTTSVVRLESGQLSNANTPNESISNGVVANAAYNNSNVMETNGRPLRVGIFARPFDSSRELSGATYYGVLNMADNVAELIVKSGNTAGQLVDALEHGDGDLETTIESWQIASLGYRGSWWSSGAGSFGHLRLSDRSNIHVDPWTADGANGIRLARTAY